MQNSFLKFPSNSFLSFAGNTYSQWHNPDDEFDEVKSKLQNMKKGNIYIGKAVPQLRVQFFKTTIHNFKIF